MSDISKIKVDDVIYDVKDTTARTEVIPIDRGGTGGTTDTTARDNLTVPLRVDLSSQIQQKAYRRSVIALCETTEDSKYIDSYSAGTLTAHRYNGLNGTIIALVTAECKLSGDYTMNSSVLSILPEDSSAQIKPCTFVYKGKHYGGLEVYSGAAQLGTVEFVGVSNFNIFGVDYWDTNSDLATISEISDSILYTTVTQLTQLQFNGSSITGTN